jgi:hypothetical protein
VALVSAADYVEVAMKILILAIQMNPSVYQGLVVMFAMKSNANSCIPKLVYHQVHAAPAVRTRTVNQDLVSRMASADSAMPTIHAPFLIILLGVI